MRTVHSIFAAAIVSAVLSLPAAAGPLVSNKTQGYVQSAKARVAASRDRASGNSELAMIQLQNTMSQRQSAIQMTTSILQKTNESTRTMLKNCPTCFR